MPIINLSKILKKKEISSLLSKLSSEDSIIIQTITGEIIYGSPLTETTLKAPIKIGNDIIGWVINHNKAHGIAHLLNYTLKKELERKNLAAELLEKYEEINFLYEISTKLGACLDKQEVIRLVLEEARSVIPCTNSSIMLLNPTTNKLEIVTGWGNKNEQLMELEIGQGIAGSVLLTEQSEIINNVDQDPRFIKHPNHQIYSLICAPLIAQNRKLGVINISNSQHYNYTTEDLQLLNFLATQSAIAITNAMLYSELKEYSHQLENKVALRTAELERINQELQRMANLDGLTHVANRRRFDQYLAEQWYSLAIENNFLSLILCDVDEFKRYNDTCGHLSGDDTLIKVAKSISNSINHPAHLVARYGGEEFAVILPNTGQEKAIEIANLISTNIKNLQIIHPTSRVNRHITLSIGVGSIIPHENLNPEILIMIADQGLYQAKKQGRDRIIYQGVSPSKNNQPIL